MVDDRLSHRDVLVFRTLCALCSRSRSQDSSVSLTYANLAAKTFLTNPVVSRSARLLERTGYLDIEITKRPSPHGYGLVSGPTKFRLRRPGT
jgi:hypothetical protein